MNAPSWENEHLPNFSTVCPREQAPFFPLVNCFSTKNSESQEVKVQKGNAINYVQSVLTCVASEVYSSERAATDSWKKV